MRARAMSVLAVLMLVQSVAVADTITPWVSGTSPHLWVATLLLGVLEGAIVARLFGLTPARCIGLMIPANFLTSWIGLWLIGTLPGHDLRDDPWAALVLVVATYALTLLLEWPFVALCVRGSPGWLRRSVRGSLIAQTASYGVLVIVAIISGLARPGPDVGLVAAMQSDLRNLVTAQEAYFVDHETYSSTAANLGDSALGYRYFFASAGNAVLITQASATGWSATIRREPPDDPALMEQGAFWTTKTCGIFVGTATPPMAGQEEGVPKCR